MLFSLFIGSQIDTILTGIYNRRSSWSGVGLNLLSTVCKKSGNFNRKWLEFRIAFIEMGYKRLVQATPMVCFNLSCVKFFNKFRQGWLWLGVCYRSLFLDYTRRTLITYPFLDLGVTSTSYSLSFFLSQILKTKNISNMTIHFYFSWRGNYFASQTLWSY